MKSTLIVCALTMVCAASLCAKEYAPVKSSVKQVKVYQPERYSLSQGGTISNELSSTSVTLTQTKSNGKQAPNARFTFESGNFGFCGLVNFCKFTVNGIKFENVSPKAEDLTVWNEGKNVGIELKMNFDGAKIVYRLYKRPDSPVTWCKVYPAKDSVEPVEKISIDFACIPSHLAKKDGKVVWGNQGIYNRTGVTAARTIPQSNAKVQITPEDKYLVFQDQNFDGSSEAKGWGPCMLILPDFKSVEKAEARINDDWTSAILVILKPDFKSFEFGIWQQKPRISNADFAKKLAEEKEAFTLK